MHSEKRKVVSEVDASCKSHPETVYRRYLDFSAMVRGGRIAANWLPDGSSFWFVCTERGERKVLKYDATHDTLMPLFDVARLRRAILETLGYEPGGNGLPFDEFHFVGPQRVSFALGGRIYELALEQYKLSCPVPLSNYGEADLVCSEAQRAVARSFPRWKFTGTGRRETSPEAPSPDGRWMAGIENYNLALRSTLDGQQIVLTEDGTSLAFWDVESQLWNPWSPSGCYLAVFKQHTQGMPRVPVVEWLKPWETSKEIIAMPAGGTLNRSELYLVDMYSQKPVAVDLGDTTDHYLRIVSWLRDGKELVLARYDRLFRRVDVLAVNALTRTVRTLLTEECATFLGNHHKCLWSFSSGLTPMPDGSGFLWQSERSGFEHLYHYGMNGHLVRQLTVGEWPVKDVVRIDSAKGWVYFTAHGDLERPYDTHLYRVSLNGGDATQLTQGAGQHAVQLSPSGACFIDTFSAVDVPPKTVLRSSSGTLIRTLAEADVSVLHAVGWTAPKEYVVKAADGVTDLWATVYLPYNFDAQKKYPLVEHIYGGPQTVWRPMDFGDLSLLPALDRQMNFNRALAQLGFVVVILDARGTPQRSKAFHDVVHRNWGQFEIADHAGAIRQLGKRLSFIDLERVGVWGLSWGGQFAFRAMTQEPALYKVGICEVPALDPYRMSLYEPYLGMPQECSAAYAAADPYPLAAQLTGELLLIGGLNDPFTPADFFKISEQLIRLGKQHRMMGYPNAGHVATGKTGEFNMDLKMRFLTEHLLAPSASAVRARSAASATA